jgi:hypothetical protein
MVEFDFSSNEICNVTFYMRSKDELGDEQRRYIQTFWKEAKKVGLNPEKRVLTDVDKEGMFDELAKQLGTDAKRNEWRITPDMNLVPVEDIKEVARRVAEEFDLPLYHTMGEIYVVCGQESYSVDGLAMELELEKPFIKDEGKMEASDLGSGVPIKAKFEGTNGTLKWSEPGDNEFGLLSDGLMLITIDSTLQYLDDVGIKVKRAYLR